MRHAKSDYPDGVADHERPLAPRGDREAALAGDWLRGNVAGDRRGAVLVGDPHPRRPWRAPGSTRR